MLISYLDFGFMLKYNVLSKFQMNVLPPSLLSEWAERKFSRVIETAIIPGSRKMGWYGASSEM